MKTILSTAVALIALSGTVAFAEGDAAKGEKDFKKCKACHSITSPEGEKIVKGGRTGPNLYGVVGRVAGSEEVFAEKYGDSIKAAGDAGLLWTEELIVEYALDPKKFLQAYLEDDGAKSMMTFKLKNGEDVAAYLATFSPAMDMEDGEDDGEMDDDGADDGDDAASE